MNQNSETRAQPQKNRFEILDVFRGFAIFLMFVYHFSYDLNEFGYISQNFTQDDFWINFRTIIVTLFLTLVGISLFLATYRGLNKKRFRQRLFLLFIYSSLVSISSWMMYPDYMIFFGILHFIAVASILGLLFVRFGVINLLLGLALIILAQVVELSFFNQPWLQWFGLMTHLPSTVDYVPLVPWFGVVLIGIYLGEVIIQLPKCSSFIQWQANHPLNRLLALGGRYSLHIYMLHQPLFFGILYIISQII